MQLQLKFFEMITRCMRSVSSPLPVILRGIIPEKYRYFFPEISGKIPQEISGNFRTPNPTYEPGICAQFSFWNVCWRW